jgi:hypothetical protein
MFITALMFIIGAVFFAHTSAYAAEEPETGGSPPPETQLIVKEVWLTGDTLHISVTDGGEGQVLELNLRDYAMPTDEYVTVQATDNAGRTSNAIQFKNPYYTASAEPPANSGGTETPDGAETPDGMGESPIPDGKKPLTPDGAGSVVDNVTDGDGKEFFTVETSDGNTFYLIVDRQRNSENVYLLNAVNEDDLASLAKPGDGKSASTVQPPPPPTTAPTQPITTPEPTPTPAPAPEKSDNTKTMAFIGIAALIIGGAAYYFKIVRPKKGGAASNFEPDDFEDEEMDVEDDDDEGGEDE